MKTINEIVTECINMIKERWLLEKKLWVDIELEDRDENSLSLYFKPEYVDDENGKLYIEFGNSSLSINLKDITDAWYEEPEKEYGFTRGGKTYRFTQI